VTSRFIGTERRLSLEHSIETEIQNDLGEISMPEVMVVGDLEKALALLRARVNKDKIQREIRTRGIAKPSERIKEKLRLALRRKMTEERRRVRAAEIAREARKGRRYDSMPLRKWNEPSQT